MCQAFLYPVGIVASFMEQGTRCAPQIVGAKLGKRLLFFRKRSTNPTNSERQGLFPIPGQQRIKIVIFAKRRQGLEHELQVLVG